MIIELKNCNSIDYGQITIDKNTLNIFYAINGTGKSTIAKALATLNGSSNIEELRPFKYRSSSDIAHQPSVTAFDSINKICVFDEKYVSQYIFQADNEVIKNSFEIFIQTPDYEKQFQIIENLIKDAKDTFVENPELNELVSDFTTFINGFGSAQSGYSAAGAIGKSLGKGNKVYNIPEGLSPFKDYIQNSENGTNAKWLKWHLAGNEFIDITRQCPYCAEEISDKTKKTIQNVSEEFDPKIIEHLNKMLEVFNKLNNYFTTTTNQKIDEIVKNVSGISDEQKKYLIQIKEQVVTLNNKLLKIKALSFTSLKDVDKIVKEISSYKIDLNYLDHLKSEYSNNKIKPINSVLDSILTKATELQRAVGIQNHTIKNTIKQYTNEINSFLTYAGYNYVIVMEENKQSSYNLKLKPYNMDTSINNADSHLSFGERNAFALVLFMYHTLKLNPDVIILDDPISSFDGNKKYAILHKLFKEKTSFRDKTVILLTHDFGTIIDIIYNMHGAIKAIANHISNKNGTLNVKSIIKDKVIAFPLIAKGNIQSSPNKISKLIHLRRLLEVENQKKEAWELLSNIFKDGREKPIYKLPGGVTREMTAKEIEVGSICIQTYINENFNYCTDYELIQNKSALVSIYKTTSSNYEKLQIYRIIKNDNSSNHIIKKFVNETFHIENDYLFQLNPIEFEMVPDYVVEACDEDIKKLYPECLASVNISKTNIVQLHDKDKSRKLIHLYELPASAGVGHWIDESAYTKIIVDELKCDYAAYILGNSMDPLIPDKSIVLVQYTPKIQNQEIGIFYLNGKVYCKQIDQNYLVSHNKKYPPIPINDYDDFYVQGKVVKIIDPAEIRIQIEFLSD